MDDVEACFPFRFSITSRSFVKICLLAQYPSILIEFLFMPCQPNPET